MINSSTCQNKFLICKGKCRGGFGYQADIKAERQVLNGSYIYNEDFDKSTKELLGEITRVSETIPVRSRDTNLSRVGWQRHWSKAKEKTSSSVSWQHFSHYKSGAKSTLISHLHALKTSVAVLNEIYLEQWSCVVYWLCWRRCWAAHCWKSCERSA